MLAPLPNSWNSFGQSISYLVLAVVVGKMLAAQAHRQNEFRIVLSQVASPKLSIGSDMLCRESACNDRLPKILCGKCLEEVPKSCQQLDVGACPV